MGGRRTVSELVSTRKTNVPEAVATIFSRYHCSSCSRCCKSGNDPFLLTAFPQDPDFQALKQRISEQAESDPSLVHLDTGNAQIYVFYGGECGFLDSGSCSVYPSRPSVCRSFPFVVHEGSVMLTSLCPPVAELKQAGIEFLYDSDIGICGPDVLAALECFPKDTHEFFIQADQKGRLDRYSFGVPILFDAFAELGSYLQILGSIGVPVSVCRDGSLFVFPIL